MPRPKKTTEAPLIMPTENSSQVDQPIESLFTDWKSKIKPEFLVPNKDRLPAGTDPATVDVSTLDESQLLILLGGFKDLARLRGFTSIDYDVIEARENYVAVKCTINWLPHEETQNLPVSFSSLADAHFENVSGFGGKFLMAIAENRAFARAVRNFLNINIVAKDELTGDDKNQQTPTVESSQPTNPINVLKKTLDEHGISLEQIKAKLVAEGDTEAELWVDLSDIPKKRMLEIIGRIKNKAKK